LLGLPALSAVDRAILLLSLAAVTIYEDLLVAKRHQRLSSVFIDLLAGLIGSFMVSGLMSLDVMLLVKKCRLRSLVRCETITFLRVVHRFGGSA